LSPVSDSTWVDQSNAFNYKTNGDVIESKTHTSFWKDIKASKRFFGQAIELKILIIC